ncbi:MAG: TenA family transcriptional regulator [Candidatus Binatia bacterium]
MPKSPDEFLKELLSGREVYHKGRATQALLIQGRLTLDQVRMWVKQYHYYRVNVPRKELYILANCPVQEVRMQRMKKYIEEEDDRIIGGTVGPHSESWAKLAEGLGVSREELGSFRDVAPEYRLLCDSWVNYARDHGWLEGAAMSFDEDVGAGRGGERMKTAAALSKFYGVPDWALVHYQVHAELDIDHGSQTHELIRKYALTDEQQEGVRNAVRFKRAFRQLEDRCIRIACKIDPALYTELDR